MKPALLRCRYCERSFTPKPRAPHQKICSQSECQRQRKSDYHREKLRSDPNYKETCLNAARKWRSAHPDYMGQYRASHANQVERNRTAQRQRDQGRRRPDLVNNNSVVAASNQQSEVYVISRPGADLVKNNSVGRPTHSEGQIYLIAPAGTVLVKNNSVLG